MSMSTFVYFIKAPGPKHEAMCDIVENCDLLGISPYPNEVNVYFDGEPEEADRAGMMFCATASDAKAECDIECLSWVHPGEMQEGFEIDLSKLDPDVTKIRFVNSY